jgi:hypothetical protein
VAGRPIKSGSIPNRAKIPPVRDIVYRPYMSEIVLGIGANGQLSPFAFHGSGGF